MISSMYIHIPFCSNICSYCAFTKVFYNKKIVNDYLKALEQEINNNYQGEVLKTIYIGGGTPSALSLEELKNLFSILKPLRMNHNIEFTVEVNPENITKEKLILMKQNGVNRISMGVESTNKKVLDYLERNHDFNLVKEKVKLIKEIGINNINVDLIYAIKGETLSDLKNDLNNLLSLEVTHISTYSLMIEPHTKLFIKKEKVIDEEIDYEMYKLICKTLKENGYNHYEISNCGKKGYESHHNIVYWNNEPYYGFGLGAAGYIGNMRYQNTTNFKDYLHGKYIKNKELLTKNDILSYALILGFRKIDGINKNEFKKKYNIDIHNLYNVKDLLKNKDLVENNDNIFINYDKIYIENSILINFIGE